MDRRRQDFRLGVSSMSGAGLKREGELWLGSGSVTTGTSSVCSSLSSSSEVVGSGGGTWTFLKWEMFRLVTLSPLEASTMFPLLDVTWKGFWLNGEVCLDFFGWRTRTVSPGWRLDGLA